MKLLQRFSKQRLFLKGDEVASWSWIEPSLPIRWYGLNIEWADVYHFPFESASFAHLRILNLLNVDIPAFPPAICEMKQLRRLMLRGAGLTKIPDGLAQLQELREIDFGGNQLKDFEVDLRACRHLKWFQISDNPLEKLPSLLPPNTGLGLAGTQFREFISYRFKDVPK